MPTYVYKFIDTGETIEVQQAFTDDSLTHAKHPATGKKLKVKKVFTPVGVTFRGGGFYKTDSRNGKPKSSSSSTTTTDSPASTSSDGKSGHAGKSSDAGKAGGSGTSGDSASSSSKTATSSTTPSKTASSSD